MTDIYILAAERSFEAASRFMDEWTQGFEPAASEYEFPQHADKPAFVYSSAVDLIKTLVKTPAEPHGLYWNNPARGNVRTAMLFFTTDGAMIAGLSVEGDQPPFLEETLRRLALTVSGREGYCAFETPPPDTLREFVDNARQAPPPKLINSVLVRAP
ncbi:hypothetical protein JQX13_13525 [Archangium violaceum]|uniref:hypothetical protein n=1 Tax=Archangium violaceum TaxID=83451 RepID=UPI00193B26CD|nr:hypothetical protein [Archangium violaceum]QRK10992.1 hypothetical protein JQX13_13525 [Archangium violaceum]